MAFDREYFNLGYLDMLSYKDTFVHRLDPRAKLFAVAAFVVIVVSFPKDAVSGMAPLFFFPVLLALAGDIPPSLIVRRVLLVSPFAIGVGVFNPLLDRGAAIDLWGLPVSGGWLSFASLMIKFTLTVSAALLLIATTSFPEVCRALQRLGLPEIFVTQLLFLYRYVFVLMDETMKMVRARDMRSFGDRGRGIASFIPLAGVLFIRSLERAERLHRAMLSRGFDGRIRSLRQRSLTAVDVLAAISVTAVFVVMRKVNLAVLIGNLLIGRIGGS